MPARVPTHKPRSKRTLAQLRVDTDRRRGSAHARGYTKSWSRYSADRLKRFPLCEEHQRRGLVVPGQCTDHVLPVSGPDDPLFWDESNHQTLCWSCHSIKTATVDGGFGNMARSTASSWPFIGVDRIGNRWKASIGRGRTKRYLGLFDTAEKAAVAYNIAALARYGSSARVNVIDGKGGVKVQPHRPATVAPVKKMHGAP